MIYSSVFFETQGFSSCFGCNSSNTARLMGVIFLPDNFSFNIPGAQENIPCMKKRIYVLLEKWYKQMAQG